MLVLRAAGRMLTSGVVVGLVMKAGAKARLVVARLLLTLV